MPLSGVYAVRVYGVDIAGSQAVIRAASVGIRPTVRKTATLCWRLFLLDFQGDLYGRRIVVEFVQRIRGEEKFESLDALTAQMHRDITAVRTAFAQAGS